MNKTQKIKKNKTQNLKKTHKIKKTKNPNDKPVYNPQNYSIYNDNIIKMCESGKYSSFVSNFYNKENEEKLKDYVLSLDRFPKYRKYTNPYEKRMKYLTDRFSNSVETPEGIKQIKTDFYSYINQEWFQSIKIDTNPKYYVQVDNFRVLQEKVYYELIEYIKKYILNNSKSNKAISINKLYSSMTNLSTVNTLRHCREIVNEVEEFMKLDKTTGLYNLLSDLNSNEIISWGSPIQWSMVPDEKSVKKYISHLSPAQLSINDYLIYIDDPNDDKETTKYKNYIKTNYLKYIKNVFDVCLDTSNHKYNPQDIWDIELLLLDAMGCTTIKKDNHDFYNEVSAEELESVYGLNWNLFTKLLGFKEPPQKIIVSSLNALKCTIKLLHEQWNTPKWKTYWLYVHFRQMIRFENTLRHIHFNFYDKILQGVPIQMPDDIYPIFSLSMCFNTLLTELYIENNYNGLYVNYVIHLAQDLKDLFIRKLSRNDWLTPSTKMNAINKLKQLKLIVGKPDKLRYDPIFDYTIDDPWHNMRVLTKWKFKKYINLDGKDVIDIPEIDWKEFKIVGTQAYMVNAYYTPTSNSIYIPMAYLQPPFIDLKERGLEYNLAFIGYTIAHELSHCLDDNGSKFDEHGNLKDWWTTHDRNKFEKKIDDVVNQYRDFAERDGIYFDPEIGIGEDLADISGMSLVEEYLRDFLIVNGDIEIIKRYNLKKLYIYLAIQGKQKIYKNAIKAQLKFNPHPLEKYRVNIPLSRLEIFKGIYNIKKQDKMWWHNNDTIW
jgi:putative endopeptidase